MYLQNWNSGYLLFYWKNIFRDAFVLYAKPGSCFKNFGRWKDLIETIEGCIGVSEIIFTTTSQDSFKPWPWIEEYFL